MSLGKLPSGSSTTWWDDVRRNLLTLECAELYAWICNRPNSCLLVQQLKSGDLQLVRHLWQSLLATPYSFPVMTDQFGWEVVEAWLFSCTKDQLWALVRVIVDMDKQEEQNALIMLSKDTYGCLLVMDIIEACKDYGDLLEFILTLLQEGEMSLIQHERGHEVYLSYFRQLIGDEKLESLQRIDFEFQEDGFSGLIAVSTKRHGCRVVTDLIELLKDDEESVDYLTTVLERGVIYLMDHKIGHHVLLCCLQFLSCEHCTFIFDAATVYFTIYLWESHSVFMTYFLIVLRRCLTVAPPSRRAALQTDIARTAMDLSMHRHGSKLLLFILRDSSFEDCKKMVVEKLMNSYALLSRERFSSLVVKQCLIFSFLSDVGSCLRILTELVPLSDEVADNKYLTSIVNTASIQFERYRSQYEETGLTEEMRRIADLLKQLDHRDVELNSV